MSVLQTLRYLLSPPRCLACGELIPIDRVKGALCATCLPIWQSAIRRQCRDCFLPYFDCRCVLPRLARAGVTAQLKLMPYDESGAMHKSMRRMLLKMKSSSNEKRFSFLAGELSLGVKQALEAAQKERAKQGLAALPTVIAYLPRAKRTARVVGVDQAKRLAHSLSRQTGFPVVEALRRRRDPLLSQKSLSAKERLLNVRGLFTPAESVEGLCVLLVDDIVTTGVSISEAARVLKRSGAAEVVAVSVACTELHARVRYKRV